MPEYLTPGVYVEEVSFRAPSIEGVGTSTAGFAGVTLTGPTNTTPELLTSFGDYQNIYGGYESLTLSGNTSDPKNTNYLSMAVKAFFDNGGSQLYVSRVFVPKSPTDTGIAASGISAANNVIVSARFPGASGNQTVTVKLKAARTQNVASLPQGSVVVSAANTSSLALPVAANDTVITLVTPLPWGAPTSVLVDTEAMTVAGTDATGTKLTVTRGGGAAPHSAGAAVLGPVGSLFTGLAANVNALTITTAPPLTTTPAPTTTAAGTTTAGPTTTAAATTTAPPTTTAAGTTTVAPTTTPAPAKATKPPNGIPALLQIDSEILAVTQVDATGTVVTVTRANPVAHSANAPVFAPIGVFTNGTGTSFQNGAGTLPAATLPASMS